MSRVVRHRTRSETTIGSYSTQSLDPTPGPVTDHPVTLSLTSTCDDSHGQPVIDSNLSLSSQKDNLRVYGTVTSPGLFRTRYVFNGMPTAVSAGTLDTSQLATPAGWELTTVARTNPSRPVMTPPSLLQDLIDIPGQLRQLGKLIRKPKSLMSPREVANHYLCVQFGWLPLIEDLHQILDLQSYIDRRCQELNSLYSDTGLRRKITLNSDEQSGSGTTTWLGSGQDGVFFDYDISVKRKVWATIHWKPTTPPPFSPGDASRIRLARRIVLGLTVEGMAKGLWDVIPWTWLIGYFTNIGSYALAHSNTVPAQHSQTCLMKSCERTYTPKGVRILGTYKGNANLTGSPYRADKTRLVSSTVTPGFNVPFLDTFRLSILSSLFVQRTMR